MYVCYFSTTGNINILSDSRAQAIANHDSSSQALDLILEDETSSIKILTLHKMQWVRSIIEFDLARMYICVDDCNHPWALGQGRQSLYNLRVKHLLKVLPQRISNFSAILRKILFV